jgi:biopolymer transport protein TolR
MATSAGSAGRSTVKAEPNVIPMIDIMLVLLIIFMIVTPLIAAGFKNLDKRPEGEGEIILGLDAGGQYFLNGKGPVDPGVLEEQLKAMYAARTEDKILYFKADNELKFARIQDAVELARRSGARVMAAITEPKIQGGLFDAAVKEN